MRKSNRISPSALQKFEKDIESYFVTYCADTRTERDPQSKPASVGSSFDAYVKAALIEDLFDRKELNELFESQVEPQNRDFALAAGRHVMDDYVFSGAYQVLRDLLENAREEPQFEFNAQTTIDGLPIGGKPDCRFVHREGAHVILDWKVNGYCGIKGAVSPKPGYMICRDGAGWGPKGSRSNGTSHKLFELQKFLGLDVSQFFMEQVNETWASQIIMYAWMMGETVGEEKVVLRIEQVAAKPQGKGAVAGDRPLLRFATHSARASAKYQFDLLDRLKKMWFAIQNDYIFTELSKEENDIKCQLMNDRARSMLSDGTEDGDFFAKCARPPSIYRG
jgi:hypothetical protein